ncbi:MAG: hypothetical protein O7G88_05670 [bacterium]|nr:hypothetical protein [bacterium]
MLVRERFGDTLDFSLPFCRQFTDHFDKTGVLQYPVYQDVDLTADDKVRFVIGFTISL